MFKDEFKQPSNKLIKYYLGICERKATENAIKEFSEIVKEAYQQYINDSINERLKTAIVDEKPTTPTTPEPESRIVTTEEEIEGYHIIKAILCKEIESSRITYHDFTNWFNVTIDNSIKKTICKLYLTETEKHIGFINSEGKETKQQIKTIEDIYQFSDRLKEIAKKYVTSKGEEKNAIKPKTQQKG